MAFSGLFRCLNGVWLLGSVLSLSLAFQICWQGLSNCCDIVDTCYSVACHRLHENRCEPEVHSHCSGLCSASRQKKATHLVSGKWTCYMFKHIICYATYSYIIIFICTTLFSTCMIHNLRILGHYVRDKSLIIMSTTQHTGVNKLDNCVDIRDWRTALRNSPEDIHGWLQLLSLHLHVL